MSLAITPQGKVLYVAIPNALPQTYKIRIFRVAINGTLTPVGALMAVPGWPTSMKVQPNGKFLAVSLGDVNEVAMYSIGPIGTLTAVPGSPFPAGAGLLESGVDFNCGGNLLFGGALISDGDVDVFSVAKNGALSPVAGSPFHFNLGSHPSGAVLWNPFGHTLFVSNQGSGSVTDFIVGSNGKLTPGANQPVNLGGYTYPYGLAVNTILTPIHTTETLLYVADWVSSSVFVFTVDLDGTLTAVPGSPFPTGQDGYTGLTYLAVDPPGACRCAD